MASRRQRRKGARLRDVQPQNVEGEVSDLPRSACAPLSSALWNRAQIDDRTCFAGLQAWPGEHGRPLDMDAITIQQVGSDAFVKRVDGNGEV